MHFITFLTLPINKVLFTVSSAEGKTYSHFPRHLCGEYYSGLNWMLKLSGDELSFNNPDKKFNISLKLSSRFKLRKLQGFYVLEHTLQDDASIALIRFYPNKLVLYMLRIEDWNCIPNASALLVDEQDGIATYRTNKCALNALLLHGFFTHQLHFSKVTD